MNYVIKMTSDDGEISYFDGAVFTQTLSEARVISGLKDARYLQGLYQSQFTESEVTKVVATTAITLS